MYTSALLCLSLYISYAAAANYTCYVCSSVDTGCGEGLDNTASITETSGCEYCGKAYGSIAGISGYTRACMSTCTVSDINFFGIRSWQKCCSGHYCNTATTTGVNLLLAGVLLLAVNTLRR